MPKAQAAAVSQCLVALAAEGASPHLIAMVFQALAEERRNAASARDALELVWTGPDVARASRSTAVVVRQLLASAQVSVLVSGFVVYRGKELFAPLAQRMDATPGLRVRFFLNVARTEQQAKAPAEDVLRAFADTFRAHHWPGERLPELYHDPRSLQGPATHAVLHAKCVVVDGLETLVTSANFTEAAQHRNVEAGLRVRDARLAAELTERFDELVRGGQLVAVGW